ncbi:hypothetical protein PC129_g14826 [Phytophthora cactorum]|uniref:Uncharacterized protein n=1 Tax=Phytophthora cactorum TaxID=29920 RepID=A0A329RU29_9STRA|nr:hypothetical protein Pcac1_g28562 [Phytophthora cactorum]KAG2809468.1 hypothetical protein PC112_g16495 [Phytophthora cactorum]KAG2811108.1 hypothetical protein PC111_g15374 [Phytophthora cactorum]KAG2850745.1 hypothetical protein PC113_g16509 [Phytophthora cactorum]KAG2889311.1 hypothetical protein PC114_g18013 [Phytophthora cactorum]
MATEDILEAVDLLISRSAEKGCLSWKVDLKDGIIRCSSNHESSTDTEELTRVMAALTDAKARLSTNQSIHRDELLRQSELLADLNKQLESTRERAALREKQLLEDLANREQQIRSTNQSNYHDETQHQAELLADLNEQLTSTRENAARREKKLLEDLADREYIYRDELLRQTELLADLNEQLTSTRENAARREKKLLEDLADRDRVNDSYSQQIRENADLREQVADRDRRLEDAATARTQLEQDLATLQATNSDIADRLNGLISESQSAYRQISLQLDAAVSDKQRMIDEYEEIAKCREKTLECDLETARAETTSLLAQLETLKTDSQEIIEDLNTRLYRVLQERDDIASVAHGMDDVETIASLHETVASLSESITSMQEEITELERTVEEKTEAYATLKRSYDQMMAPPVAVKGDYITKGGTWKDRPRCHGLTKTGVQCGRLTAEVGGYCHLHVSQRELAQEGSARLRHA